MENNAHPQIGSKRPLSAVNQQPAQAAPAPAAPAAPVPVPAPAAATVAVAPVLGPSGLSASMLTRGAVGTSASSRAAPASNGGGAAAAAPAAPAATAPTAGDDPKPRYHGKPAYGPDMQILEVTNNGDPANMEMLIHLKVHTARVVCTKYTAVFHASAVVTKR